MSYSFIFAYRYSFFFPFAYMNLVSKPTAKNILPTENVGLLETPKDNQRKAISGFIFPIQYDDIRQRI